MAAQMVTGHRLRDGVVLFYVGDRRWSDFIGDGKIVEGKDTGNALLAEAKESEADQLATGSYLIDILQAGDGPPRPAKKREHIRAVGPTVRKDLAKHPDRQPHVV